MLPRLNSRDGNVGQFYQSCRFFWGRFPRQGPYSELEAYFFLVLFLHALINAI